MTPSDHSKVKAHPDALCFGEETSRVAEDLQNLVVSSSKQRLFLGVES